MNIAHNIKTIRKAYNLTQRELAEKTGSNQKCVGTYETATAPPYEFMIELSKFSKISIHDIVVNKLEMIM